MLIVLEGCDGVGKSTLAQRLATIIELAGFTPEVLHRGPLDGSALDAYELDLETYEPRCGRHIICDRWHLGELVYGPALRGRSRMSVAEQRHIEMFLERRGAMGVHVIAPGHELHRRINERGDDLVGADRLEDLTAAYHRAMYQSRLPWWPLDTAADPAHVPLVINTASRLEQYAARLTQFSTYVGSATPYVLLLGEIRKLNDRYPDAKSAFVPRPNTSGEYLLRFLPDDLGMTCGLANALEEDIGELFLTLGQPLVVALGREAQRQCEQAELPHGTVPHPQFVRRFKHGLGPAYGDAIREAALFGRDMTDAVCHPGT